MPYPIASCRGRNWIASLFKQQMLALPGLIAYWPSTEKSGTVADNLEGTAARDGTYTGAVTLAEGAFPASDNLVKVNGPTVPRQYIDIYSASLNDAFDGDTGWILGWGQLTDPLDTVRRTHSGIVTDAGSACQLYVQSQGNGKLYLVMTRGGTLTRVILDIMTTSAYRFFGLCWDKADDALDLFIDGVLVATRSGLGVWSGDIVTTKCLIGGITTTGSDVWLGNTGHVALGSGQLVGELEVNTIWESVYPGSGEVTFSGDSKATDNDTWCQYVVDNLRVETDTRWRERPWRIGLTGDKVADLHTYLDTNLPTTLGNPSNVCIIVGANDLSAGTTEGNFKTDLRGCIDAYQAKWSSIKIYIAQPWRRTYNAESASMKTWILAVIAEYGSNVFAGPDETAWLENGDDGTTYTLDGIHYNAAGMVECAAQWMTAMGY